MEKFPRFVSCALESETPPNEGNTEECLASVGTLFDYGIRWSLNGKVLDHESSGPIPSLSVNATDNLSE